MAVAVGIALVLVPPAAADDAIEIGSHCPSSELGNASTTPNGTSVRCLATEDGGFNWVADTGATGTIGDLQKQGFSVTIDRVGAGALADCRVTGVRNPVTVTQTTDDPIGPHSPTPLKTITISKTISVSLDCT
ncbi:hypothetical protein [Mycolicibacterium porcinum]